MNADSSDLFRKTNARNSSTHLWIARPDGCLDYVNGCWQRFAGRAPADILSHGWQTLVHPDDLPEFMAAWREACRSGVPLRREIRLLADDGSAHGFLVRAEPLADEDGTVVNWHGVNTPLPQPSAAKHEYGGIQDEDAAAVVARIRTRMVASAHHDLRQPLSAVSFLSNALAKRLHDPISQDVLSAMIRAVQSMQNLVDGQLYFDQVDSGNVQPRFVDHSINSSLVRLANEFSPMAEREGLGFTLHPCSASVRTDPALLDTMLKNLVCNALRYTAEGRVVVGCRRQGNWLRIHVLDTGRGIAAEELGLIWQDFFRSSQSVREYPGGYGLGLSVVKRLAERLGHSIEVTTKPGHGSCFTIKVPLSDRSASLPLGETVVQTLPLAGLRVLVLDEDPVAAGSIRLLVEEWGGEIRSVRTVAEAEKLIAKETFRPDAILADYRFSGTASGIFTMHNLIGRFAQVFRTPLRGIVLSEESGDVREREVRLAGYGMITKPIAPEALYQALGSDHWRPDQRAPNGRS